MTEKQIESGVCKYAREKGCWVRKFSSPAHRGVPDRVFMTPSGRVFFIEFKGPTGKLSKLQEREFKEIKAHGGHVHAVYSMDVGNSVIDLHLSW